MAAVATEFGQLSRDSNTLPPDSTLSFAADEAWLWATDMEEKRDLILLDTAVDDRLTLLCVWGNWDRGVEDEKILAYSDPNIVIRRF